MMAFGTMFRVRGVDYSRLYDYLEAHPERFWQHEFGVMTLENARQSHENGEMSVMRVVVDLPEGKTGLLQVYNMSARDEAVPVSYTHLDVYKRQADSGGFCSCPHWLRALPFFRPMRRERL